MPVPADASGRRLEALVHQVGARSEGFPGALSNSMYDRFLGGGGEGR